MEMGGDVARLASELARAVEVTMNTNANQNDRMEAYMACERFKENSPLCAQAGMFLTSGQYPLTVRHFGLQLMEHTVKFKWYTISQQEKLFVKENAMKLLANGVGAAEDASLMHIKDALSRIIVEMIKREWPQQWTTLLAELSDACVKGEAQTELVLLIFLRLVEDVALLQTMESSQRRKDIYSALTANMSEIFDFFMRLIELHVNSFRNAQVAGNGQQALSHARVVQVVLPTITGFVEWVSTVHILANEGRLIHILCILLNDEAFQVGAAECFAQILNRKTVQKEKIPLSLLYRSDMISFIYRSVAAAETSTKLESYNYLKKVVPVLTGLASQLTSGKTKEEGIPCNSPSFITFLETVMMLTRHPSLYVAHGGALIWITLLRYDHIARDPVFVEYVPKIIELSGPKIIKVLYPTKRPVEITLDPRVFASIDYDSEEEFSVFFHRVRTDFIDIFRLSTMISPLVAFGFCEQWMLVRLQKAMVGEVTNMTVQDPIYLEWEAVSLVLDAVIGRILMVTERPSVQSGLRLLEECLKVDNHDPLILSIILSCISSLFMFLSMSSCQITAGNCVAMSGVSLLPRVLQKIFACLVFTDRNPEPNVTTAKAVKNLRRHSAALMVKLGIKYPLLLLPVFDQINNTIQGLISTPNQLTRGEKTTMQEALLQISNHFCDYERQTTFISEIVAEGRQQWLNMGPALKSSRDFINFIGLDLDPKNIQMGHPQPHPTVINRTQVTYAINIVLGVIKRCSWPDDPDRASRGGFVVGLTESGNPISRNPATPHVIPLLPHILSLVRVTNELFSSVASFAEVFSGVHAMQETEKRALLGHPVIVTDPMDPQSEKVTQRTEVDRMQQFLYFLFETNYHLVGSMGPSMGRDLYQIPGIADAVIGSVFANIENVPDNRLRVINRVFMKPFVFSCPPAFYDTVLLPVFAYLAPFMLNRLTARWQYISSLYETGELGEDVSDTQEVVEDIVYRALAREYLELLKVALVGGTLTTDHSNPMGDDTMDQDDLSMDGAPHQLTRAAQSAMASEIISDLGGKLLHCPATCSPIVLTVLNILTWNDSMSCFKATVLTGPIMRYLAGEGLTTDSLASTTMMSVLQGLQVHGQHDTNQTSLITLGVQVYEILRPKFPIVIEVMQKIPNITIADMQKLDEKIATGSTKGNKIEKGKRDLFKKITSQVIGKNASQLFKKEIKIVELPPLQMQNRRSNNQIGIDGSVESGIPALFNTKS
ncbi:Exportin-5 [Sergentomyia squamirostris]